MEEHDICSGDSVTEKKILWTEHSLPTFPCLDKDLTTDVCIIGGGITGLTSAYTLAKAGKSCVVIDKDLLGHGQSCRTTAHLSWALDERYCKLINYFSEDIIKLIIESHSSAIDYIEKIIREENIDCDFERVNGYLFPDNGGSSADIPEKEFLCLQNLGIKTELLSVPPRPFIQGPCLVFPRQAKFHIMKYLHGLILALQRYGAQIYTHTPAVKIENTDHLTVTVKSGYKIQAKSLIVATCTPINNRFYLHTKQAAYRSYVIAAPIPKDSFPEGLFWDTAEPYHYIRTQKNDVDPTMQWIIIGGEDHKTGQCDYAADPYLHLLYTARKYIPQIKEYSYKWSGQFFVPIDSIGFIGKNPGEDNVYIATGDAGNGMTHGTIAGILIPDLILGKENAWKEVYRPGRKTIRAGDNYIKENINTLMQYKDLFTPGELKRIEDLPIDRGMIIRRKLQKIAIYKDFDKKIHCMSAICSHLGGCVRWNTIEKTWDCPCHGSEFDKFGRVVIGPANEDLKPMNEG